MKFIASALGIICSSVVFCLLDSDTVDIKKVIEMSWLMISGVTIYCFIGFLYEDYYE